MGQEFRNSMVGNLCLCFSMPRASAGKTWNWDCLEGWGHFGGWWWWSAGTSAGAVGHNIYKWPLHMWSLAFSHHGDWDPRGSSPRESFPKTAVLFLMTVSEGRECHIHCSHRPTQIHGEHSALHLSLKDLMSHCKKSIYDKRSCGHLGKSATIAQGFGVRKR